MNNNNIKIQNKNINKNIKKHLSEPWFTIIMLGLKTVEGRLNKGVFKELNVGDTITFYNDDVIYREYKTKITKISYYDTFEEYLNKETLNDCLPGYTNIEDGLEVYYKYFTKEDERHYKIKAFTLNNK